ncbi:MULTISPECIES: nuclear transport factor 2 family protein [unclassified Pseudoalteromonas]|uniref:nuclear transport factor 2 family protein n=1 Tax=unclassified Pseudoalteromonas TaxID=194690 RepID=UPI002096AD26|nr:nuclear transport factor 2 family protein [Pseudoalteromonas sp. XMcav2-N]MCO7187440.1 nuclear transport factor 2 family protein [Pseudoalteromonas sp. XMcav2-N]
MSEHNYIDLVEAYIHAYNTFDISAMLALLDEHIVFENESNGEVTASAHGKAAFEQLAVQGAALFETRQQTIRELALEEHAVTAYIQYQATLAADLPNGLSAGDTLELKGETQFRFHNNKITYIKDVS